MWLAVMFRSRKSPESRVPSQELGANPERAISNPVPHLCLRLEKLTRRVLSPSVSAAHLLRTQTSKGTKRKYEKFPYSDRYSQNPMGGSPFFGCLTASL